MAHNTSNISISWVVCIFAKMSLPLRKLNTVVFANNFHISSNVACISGSNTLRSTLGKIAHNISTPITLVPDCKHKRAKCPYRYGNSLLDCDAKHSPFQCYKSPKTNLMSAGRKPKFAQSVQYWPQCCLYINLKLIQIDENRTKEYADLHFE